jgi:hypothetical protein
MVMLGGLLYFFGGRDVLINIWEQLTTNTGVILSYVGIYISIGIVWSFVKWYFFLLKKRDRLKELLVYSPDMRISIPSAAEYKGRIISWMTYWPFSGVWTIINDPIKRLFKYIYGRFNNLYQAMSNNMFSELKN